ncbi:MAG TPA: AAA-like domain-containing protein, partial [Terriglobales bacterium]|nr:AAA-like domain-containing protein [Terriglobales bacterium]
GIVPLNSKYYVVRPVDEEFNAAISRQDSIVLVKGARQMGKTSLLARGLEQARKEGRKVVVTDFQMLNTADLQSAETLFKALAASLDADLLLDSRPLENWNSQTSSNLNFRMFVEKEVLGKISAPLVWGLDEVDRLFTSSFGGEVFGLFRSWHNRRSLEPASPLSRLTLAIAYATEAHLFITDVNQSPFNVGTRLTLEDFTFEQVADLNRRYGTPLQNNAELSQFFQLVGGQPYLVRRGLHELVTRDIRVSDFARTADRDEGIFGDHLRRILVMLAKNQPLLEIVRGMLRGRPCPTRESFYRLRTAGTMTGESMQDARLRCQVYANYLQHHLS